MSFFQKITGYTSIVIYGSVVAPSTEDPTIQESSPTLTATVTQPKAEESTQSKPPETGISATVEQKEEYVNRTILLQIINQTEDLKTKLDKLRTSSRTVLNYYSSINDIENVEKWVNVVTLFNQAIDDIEKTQNYIEGVKDSATKENSGTIKSMITDVLKTLDKIIKIIKNN